MWIVASIPFWILGVLFVMAGFAAIKWKKATTEEEVQQFIGCMLAGGVLLYLAAKIAS